MDRFVLMGNGPLSNRGCEAIVLGTRAILEREFGPAEFLLASFADDSQASLPGDVHPAHLDEVIPGTIEDAHSVVKEVRAVLSGGRARS